MSFMSSRDTKYALFETGENGTRLSGYVLMVNYHTPNCNNVVIEK